MGVVPVGVRVLRHVQPRKPPVWSVQHIHLDLITDHALLVLEVVDGDVQPAHTISFRPQRRLQLVRGQHLVVVGEIEARRTVKDSTVLLHQLDELHLAQVLRTLEHHVFEQVREARAVLRLDAEPDPVIHPDRNRRRAVVRREHHLQPIRQLEIFDRYLELFTLPQRRTHREQQAGDSEPRTLPSHTTSDAPTCKTALTNLAEACASRTHPQLDIPAKRRF